jgi:hypothetical protein
MKRFRFASIWFFIPVFLLGVVTYEGSGAAAEPACVKVQLIWGTDDERSPDARHKAIDEELAKKLSKSPFRWKHYFEVNRQFVCMSVGEAKTGIKMSSHCVIDLKNLGKDRFETKLYGKGKLLETRKDSLPKDTRLILAGNAENETAWLVVIKRVDPSEMPKPDKSPAK